MYCLLSSSATVGISVRYVRPRTILAAWPRAAARLDTVTCTHRHPRTTEAPISRFKKRSPPHVPSWHEQNDTENEKQTAPRPKALRLQPRSAPQKAQHRLTTGRPEHGRGHAGPGRGRRLCKGLCECSLGSVLVRTYMPPVWVQTIGSRKGAFFVPALYVRWGNPEFITCCFQAPFPLKQGGGKGSMSQWLGRLTDTSFM